MKKPKPLKTKLKLPKIEITKRGTRAPFSKRGDKY